MFLELWSDIIFTFQGNERLAAIVALSRFMQTSSNAWVTTLFGMNTLFDVAPSSEISRPAACKCTFSSLHLLRSLNALDFHSTVFMEQVVDAWLRSQVLFTSNAASDAPSAAKQTFDPYVPNRSRLIRILADKLGLWVLACRLFVSETTLMNSGESTKNIVTSYNLTHSPSSGASISDAISSELWSETPNRFFSSLAHVLPISITRTARNVWGDISPLSLEEDLYMGK